MSEFDALFLGANALAGLGLRQGEIFDLSPDDIDIDSAEVRVVRQVKIRSSNKLLFGLPKGRKTRTVPLPASVLEAINAHMTKFPPRDVTMAWDRLDGTERTISLLLTTRETRRTESQLPQHPDLATRTGEGGHRIPA